MTAPIREPLCRPKGISLMRLRTIAVAALALVFLAVEPLGAAGQGLSGGGALSAIPVSGTSAAGSFAGTLKIDRFASQDRQLVAIGTVTGTLRDSAGLPLASITDQPVTVPVTSVETNSGTPGQAAAGPIDPQQATQECQILHLEFGGITLDVLGIGVMLSPITLDLTLSGLLGNILCGLLGALGSGAPAPAMASQLNHALGLNP